LIQYVHGLKKKQQKGDNLEAECGHLQPSQIILKLISEHDAIFSDQNDKEIEACMNVVSATIKKLEPEVGVSITEKLREAVVANPSDRPILRLRILTNIYHALDRGSPHRYDIFVAMVSFAAESGNAELMIPKFKQIDQWLLDWRATIDQTRKLYKLARKILAANNRSLQAHEFITKYLQTFNGDIKEGKQLEEDVVNTAAEAAREAISADEILQCDHLFSLEAVRLLEHHPQHATLYRLLQIFAQEKLDSFLHFQTSNPNFLQSTGLTEESCLRKIRLLSLASLGAENAEVTYGLIAQTLQISEEDVEDWIIDAVSIKLIEAKINQLKRSVTIGFCIQRVFTIAQWKQLSVKLNKWKGNVGQVLQTIQHTNHTGAKIPPIPNPTSAF